MQLSPPPADERLPLSRAELSSPEGRSPPSWSLALAPWSRGVCSVGSDPASAPGASEGASAPLDRRLQGHRDGWVPVTRMCSLSAPPEPSAGASPGSRERLWERPRQTPRWLQGVSWGSVGHPGLGERALDQAQDDSMRKKCPQEEDLASAAKTTTLVTASSPLSPQWDEQGDSRLPGPSRGPQTRGWDPRHTHAPSLTVSVSHCLCISLSLCLTVSVSHCLHVSVSPCLTVSVSHRLCVSPSLTLAVSVSHCLTVSVSRCLCLSLPRCLCVSLCLTVSFTVSVSSCLCVLLSPCLTVSMSRCLCI